MSKKYILTGALAAVFLLPGQLYADKCGKKDRVSLPSCVASVIAPDKKSFQLQNNCSHTVTIKADIDNDSDDLITMSPGVIASGLARGGSQVTLAVRESNKYMRGANKIMNVFKGGASVRALKCCPRYNRCG